MNNYGRIDEKTKQIIKKIADELQYEPNKLARSLVRKNSINIAAFLLISKNYHKKMKAGIVKAQEEFTTIR